MPVTAHRRTMRQGLLVFSPAIFIAVDDHRYMYGGTEGYENKSFKGRRFRSVTLHPYALRGRRHGKHRCPPVFHFPCTKALSDTVMAAPSGVPPHPSHRDRSPPDAHAPTSFGRGPPGAGWAWGPLMTDKYLGRNRFIPKKIGAQLVEASFQGAGGAPLIIRKVGFWPGNEGKRR